MFAVPHSNPSPPRILISIIMPTLTYHHSHTLILSCYHPLTLYPCIHSPIYCHVTFCLTVTDTEMLKMPPRPRIFLARLILLMDVLVIAMATALAYLLVNVWLRYIRVDLLHHLSPLLPACLLRLHPADNNRRTSGS